MIRTYVDGCIIIHSRAAPTNKIKYLSVILRTSNVYVYKILKYHFNVQHAVSAVGSASLLTPVAASTLGSPSGRFA